MENWNDIVWTTIEEFVKEWENGKHEDVDVYDNVCDEIGIAFCGQVRLTEEGKDHFKEVLTYNIKVDEDCQIAIVDVDAEEGVWQKKLKKAKEFFHAAAGYCADDDYKKWFKEIY